MPNHDELPGRADRAVRPVVLLAVVVLSTQRPVTSLLSLQFAVQHTELPFCVRVLSGNVSPLAGDAGAVGTS